MKALATIGYEKATVESFLEALKDARVELLVDVRAAARSRRHGFAKTRLTENVQSAGIEYIHLPALGTPADGRAAARAGRHSEMQAIFREYLETSKAQDGLDELVGIIESGKRVCLLCLEADPAHCHRSLVADAIAARTPVRIDHLHAEE